jgi:mutator protein MutT
MKPPAGEPVRREVAAAVVVHAGRVLVQTRPAGRGWSGYWEFPGGKLEAGEDAAACATRECEEELGLSVRVVRSLAVVDWEYPDTAVRVAFLLCAPAAAAVAASVAADPPAVRAREGQQVLWADRATLPTLRFLPANAGVLALLADLLPAAGSGRAPTAS